MTDTRLGIEVELWVIDKLTEGVAPAEVVGALASEGLARPLAEEKVAEILRAPSFKRLRVRTARAAMAERILLARREIGGPVRVDTVATIDRERFRRDYWERGRPVLVTEAAREMRAVRDWTLLTLARDFGDIDVEVNVRRDRADRAALTEREAERMPLRVYLESIAHAATNERYIVSRNGLLSRPELASLWDDLGPLPAILDAPEPPRGASLWIGPAGTRSPLHFDPHNVLLVQVQGRKRIRLVPPDRVEMFERLDGYYATAHEREPPRITPEAILEVTLEAGQALFVPLGYFHEVTALDPSITLSMLCFPWPNDFHWIEPISSA